MMSVPIVIDFEASGFGQGSYPIEVGFSGRHGEGWCSLIRPEREWQQWDMEAARQHGIAREILIERGNTAQHVAEQLNHFLSGRTVYSDGWGQDYVCMVRLFDAAGIAPKFKLNDLFEIIEDEQIPRWNETKDLVRKELCVNRRRASSDARILQLTWLRTCDETRRQFIL